MSLEGVTGTTLGRHLAKEARKFGIRIAFARVDYDIIAERSLLLLLDNLRGQLKIQKSLDTLL